MSVKTMVGPTVLQLMSYLDHSALITFPIRQIPTMRRWKMAGQAIVILSLEPMIFTCRFEKMKLPQYYVSSTIVEGTLAPSNLGEAVDGVLAGAVRRVVVQSELGRCAGHAHDLATLAAGDHPLGALLGQDERRPDVHLRETKGERNRDERQTSTNKTSLNPAWFHQRTRAPQEGTHDRQGPVKPRP